MVIGIYPETPVDLPEGQKQHEEREFPMRGERLSVQLASTRRMREVTPRSQPSLTGPVLKAETVTGDLPHCVGRCGLRCQQEVLIEVALLVAIKFYCPTCHHEDCCLALSSLLFTRRSIKKTTQRLTGKEVGNVHRSFIRFLLC